MQARHKNVIKYLLNFVFSLSESDLEKRPTSAAIDLGALKDNYLRVKERVGGRASVLAVVKANAYGHGDLETAHVLVGLGCELLGVAIPEEGAKLRHGGIKSPIIVLGGIFPNQADDIVELGLTPVIFDASTAGILNSAAQRRGAVQEVHVKIDTGMGRLGLRAEEAGPFFSKLKGLSNLKLSGLHSHFAESEREDKGFSRTQIAAFQSAVSLARQAGFEPKYVGISNSADIIEPVNGTEFSMVRPGLMLYGSYPDERLRGKIELKPVLSLSTRVLHLKAIQAGESVSYGRRFVARRPSLIATLPIGYADGLPRSLGNNAEVLIRGKRAPIAGTVCMDLIMADVTDVPGVQKNDEAVIIGSQGSETITAEEVAARAGTISYEIFCRISQRVPRVYV